MAKKKKSTIEIVVEEAKKKMEEEDLQDARLLVLDIREERKKAKEGWDVKIGDNVDYFDPTLSYELTGYRPISETDGLDFDPSWFTEAREVYRKTGHYCPFLKDSKRYNEYWLELYKRCKYGYTSHGYTLTGDNYFFLNFYLLPTIKVDQASGEGTKDDFPIFFASHYTFFHYLQMARVLHKHIAMMKARSIGFSEINASLATRMYSVVRKSRVMITCFNDKFLNGTFSKFNHAINFLNTLTDGGFFKPRLIDQDLRKKSGYQVKINGLFEDAGFLSEVVGINGSNPRNIRGDRVDLLIYDESGCHAPGTEVIMYDGSLKKVEDVLVGDKLMGDDGTPRTVLELHSGKLLMYKIIPLIGDILVVNANHILYGKHRNYSKKTYKEFTMRTEDYYNMVIENPRKKDGYKLVHSNSISFKHQDVPIPPYLFGFWLGDGDSAKARFTSEDPETIEYLINYGKSLGFKVKIEDCLNAEKCKHISFITNTYRNPFCEQLRLLGVFNNKHIPDCYLYNDKQSLLELLAGLIDSDGSYDAKKHSVQFTLYEDRKELVDLVEYICHVLGMRVSRDICGSKSRQLKGKEIKGVLYRINILWGHSQIPTKLSRKQTIDRDNIKKKSQLDRLDSTFKIEKLDIGDYYGFSLDGNQLFLLKDFTVCHNSWPGLTTAVVQGQELCEVLGVPRGSLLFGGNR